MNKKGFGYTVLLTDTIKLICFVIFFSLFLISSAYGQFDDILRSKLWGTSVQDFAGSDGSGIDSFTIQTSGAYQVLRGWAIDGTSGDIFRTVHTGTSVQPFKPTSGQINRFTTKSIGEFIYLTAYSTSGDSGEIFISKLMETGVQEYTSAGGEVVESLATRGPDAEGYVYLYIKSTTPVSISDLTEPSVIPGRLFINQNIPNPFKRMTSIKFGIPLRSKNVVTRLAIYNIMGRLIRTLISEELEPGYYHVNWNCRDENSKEVTDGVYFCRLSVGAESRIKKMIYLK